MSGLPEGQDGYAGPATLEADGTVVACDVVITGFFEPIAGRYKWYGRASASPAPAPAPAGGAAAGGLDTLPAKNVRLRTPHGTAVTTVTDEDTWGRYRLHGFGAPPFPVADADADADAGAGAGAGAPAEADRDRRIAPR